METHPEEWIDQLIASQRSGYSLDQAFYRDSEIFERDRERVIDNHWMMAGNTAMHWLLTKTIQARVLMR